MPWLVVLADQIFDPFRDSRSLVAGATSCSRRDSTTRKPMKRRTRISLERGTYAANRWTASWLTG